MQEEPDVLSFEEKRVGDLVAEDYRKAEVFKKFGIDFCCGGGRTVVDACAKKGVDYDELARELMQAETAATTSEQSDFKSMDPGSLVDYIVRVHHTYVRENVPLLREFTAKVAKVHGHANPEVVRIAELFDALGAELTEHMMKEESILFPYIKRLVVSKERKESVAPPPFGSVQNPIAMMEHEHETAGNILAEIRRLSSEYSPPDHACTTYKVAYLKLEEFEGDLHKHIHLENNILFPQALAIEQELTNR